MARVFSSFTLALAALVSVSCAPTSNPGIDGQAIVCQDGLGSLALGGNGGPLVTNVSKIRAV